MSPTYADISDLRLQLDSTDEGTGTAAQLSDDQLTLSLQEATSRVSLYAGVSYDPAAVPPAVRDITLDLASWYATTYYLKQKDMGNAHPVVLRYDAAMKVLDDARSGKISLEVPDAPAGGGDGSGGAGAGGGLVINRIPNIFVHADSDTLVYGGQLYADTQPDEGRTRRTEIDYQDTW